MAGRNRTGLAESLGTLEGTLRAWEDRGIVPEFGTVPEDEYVRRVRLAQTMRLGGLSTQRIRRVLGMMKDDFMQGLRADAARVMAAREA